MGVLFLILLILPIGALPLPVDDAVGNPGTPPIPPRDTQIYSVFFIQPQMVGEMGPLIHEIPTSFFP
jgi:hypothetical protein